MQFDVAELREQQFPLTGNTTYLNNAGIAPLPKRTFDALQAANEQMMLHTESLDVWMTAATTAFNEGLRNLINARDASEIVGVTSTSLGLNLIAQAFPWKSGDNVILCDIEFPSNVYPWLQVGRQYGVEIRLVPATNGDVTVEPLHNPQK